jgi:hypothetical protein
MKVLKALLLVLLASSASAVGNGNGNEKTSPFSEAAGTTFLRRGKGALFRMNLVMHDGSVKPRGLLNA